MSSFTRWWHSLLISSSLATWFVAQPLYGFIVGNQSFEGSTGSYVLLFMLLYQGFPLLGLFIVDRVIIELCKSARLHRICRSSLFIGAAAVFLRVAWVDNDLTLGSEFASIFSAIAILATLIATVIRFYQKVCLFAIYLSIASIVLTSWFALQVGLFGDIWTNESLASLPTKSQNDFKGDPIFIIIFDGLGGEVLFHEDTIDPNLFPHFAALGKDSAVFTNATTNYLTSSNSIRSMMTGEFIRDDVAFERRPSWSRAEGILRILADKGYAVKFHDEMFRCQDAPYSICDDLVVPTGTDMYQVTRDFLVWFLPKPVSRAGRDTVLAFIGKEASFHIPFDTTHQNSQNFWESLLINVSSERSPGTVYFVHILLPHQPYEFDRTGARVRKLDEAQDFDDFPKMATAYQEQVVYVDTLLGRLIEKLKSEGLYDQSILIITGDHGPRSLALRKKFSGFATASDFPEQIDSLIPNVPLILHGPKIKPEISQLDYQHVDLLPSIVDFMMLDTTRSFEGVSVFEAQRPIREKLFYGLPNKREPGENVVYVYDRVSGLWHKR